MSFAPGTRLASYEIVALLGAGGMGEVYRARDVRLRRDVALKIIAASNEGEARRRVLSEARAAAAVSHPNICQIFEIGEEQEQAAATLGANTLQTFWRITLPAIRWGLTYGIVLTVARALGEFGAVIMVSSGFPGVSQTLTLLVHARYIDDHNTFGAYSAATLLMAIAVIVLLLMTLLDRKRSTE